MVINSHVLQERQQIVELEQVKGRNARQSLEKLLGEH